MPSRLRGPDGTFVTPKPPPPKPLAPKTAPPRKGDEFSTGQGKALRVRALRGDATRLTPIARANQEDFAREAKQARDAAALNTPLGRANRDDILRAQNEERASFASFKRGADAAEKVKAALASDPKEGPRRAAKELAAQAQALAGQPGALSGLMANAPIDALAKDLADHVRQKDGGSTRDVLEALSQATDVAGPDAAQRVARVVAAALPDQKDLFKFDDELGDFTRQGKGVELAISLGSELKAAGKTQAADGLGHVIENALESKKNQAGDARANREAADAELQHELSEFRTILTPEETAKFTAAYKEKHRDVYEAEVVTAAALNDTLTRHVDELTALAATNDDVRDGLVDAMKGLAATPLPRTAMEWASRVQTPGGPLDARVGDADLTEIAEKGTPGLLLQLQGEHPDDPGVAVDSAKELFTRFKQARAFQKISGDVTRSLDVLDELKEFTAHPENGIPPNLRKLYESEDELKGMGKLGTAMASASFAFSIVNLKNADDVTALVQSAARAGEGGLKLLTGAVGTLSESGKLAQLAEGSELGAKLAAGTESAALFAKRFLPGLGLVLNSVATVQDVSRLVHDFNGKDLVKAVGDGLATLGSAAELLGPEAAVIAKPLQFLGVGISLLGEGIFGAGDREKFNQAQLELLQQSVRQPEDMSDDDFQFALHGLAFTSADPNAIKENAGLSEAQLLRLFSLSDVSHKREFETLTRLAKAAGVQGDAFVDRALGIDQAQLDSNLDLISAALQGPTLTGEETPEEKQRVMDANARNAAIEIGLLDDA